MLSRCKICENGRKKEWLDTHPERAKKNRHNQYIKHRDEVLEYSRNYQRTHRSEVNERARKRYQANPDKFRKIQQHYVAKNPQTWEETVRRYKQAHPDKIKQAQAKFSRVHRDRVNTKEARKRARKRRLADTFTEQEWQDCLSYFGNCCAVCGRPADIGYKLAMDHWIPLSSAECPGTIATNIVPLCHGERGCNNSKLNHDAVSWLENKFGKQKAQEIFARITAYFERLKGD